MRQDVLEKHRHHTVSGVPGGAMTAGVKERIARDPEAMTAAVREKRARDQETRQQRQEEEEQRAGERQEEEDADDEDAHSPRPDIRARLIDSPEVIIDATYANRSQRTRVPTYKYQAGTKPEPRTPGRGRGRGGRGGGAD